ncbi:hypothetical protein [Aggregatibacter actinomycetemcomitans]|uniref:hypothetical protein n=1 Tax=Aggregatibacter actinomycetemcomitans TaxID=714 RepID=UPI00037B06EE|nr:hypothetical protein [Aggregatibacter actinomycetemcomitans]AHN71021.1 hypothetical protein CF65_00436 [Aggregatibacter actinomycetemcomitans HK1651]AMQ92939.1 hypothetical protein ACT74_10165 [Aggregatibacter actinomycetemcomitans]KYK82722.1 hypothetical protein SC936_00625 [Aggregatibacter actinomycetemcomitans serotype e str. SC936]MCE3057518.1 hypothetical protein [Aggregatibacter actinomycetemcomitans]QPQ80162.1 hypothetical protein I6H05_06635 [Aggregatibacter actinomycetemcomitans]
MKHATHKNIILSDLVYWKNSSPLDKGIVVCLIDEGVFLDGYDFSCLKDSGGGIMMLFDSTGLVQIMGDDKNIDIEFISHLTTSEINNFLKSIFS